MKLSVIIVAGGSGTRMGADVPKQFIPMNGKPIIIHTIKKFHPIASQIIIALPIEHLTLWEELCLLYQFDPREYNITITHGGEQRFHSVRNALKLVDPNATLVAVHDAVRPYISTENITQIAQCAETNGSAIPTINVTDTIRQVMPNGSSKTLVRSNLKAVQTPQIFDRKTILEAYKQPYNEAFTDDASVVEAMGFEVAICQGDPKNIKITYPNDIKTDN